MDTEQLQTEITTLLEQLTEDDVDDVNSLVDLYLISNAVTDDVNSYRKHVSGKITDTVAGGNVSGELGEVSIIHRNQYTLKNTEMVLKRLREAGLDDVSEVMSIDKTKVKDVCKELDIDEDDVLNTSSYSYVRKSSFEPPWD